MNLPIFGRLLDERFFRHRQRSTSIAGVSAGLLAVALFAYRFLMESVWSWDLFAVAATFIAVKLVCMTWYSITD